MNKEKYIEQRNSLMEEAQALINDGNFKEFNDKKTEIESLDNSFEEATRLQANLNALKDNSNVANIANMSNNAAFIQGAKLLDSMDNKIENDDMLNSIEYRKAFMNSVLTGSKLPQEFRNEATKTGDLGILIPTVILEKIISKIEATGMILPLVTKTNYKGGQSIPTSSVKPVATWVGEGEGSPVQKKTADGDITFAYHKLRCAVAVTLEVDIMALSIFEAKLIQEVSQAMVKALELSIVNGTGSKQPKGILKEIPNDGQALKISELDYSVLVQAEAALPLEYEEGAVYCMTKKTFMSYVGMVDANGQPIARTTYGINGKPERSLLGRNVILCNYLESYSDALQDGTVFAFLFDFSDYALNTNYNMTLKTYEDNETDDKVTKSILLADGKVLIKDSLVTIAKKSASRKA